MRKEIIFLVVLFVLALSMRFLFLEFLVSYDPRSDGVGVFSSDSPTYFTVVENIRMHGVFSMAVGEVNPEPDNYRTPGYVFFLYPFVAAGIPYWAISSVQIIFVSLGLVGWYILLRKIFSKNVSRIAVLFFALEPFTARAGSLLTATHLFMVFFPFAVLFLSIFIVRKETKWLWGGAAILGFCALIKPVAFLFFPLLVIAAWFGGKNIRRTLCNSGVALLIFFLVVSPWLIRNKIVLNTWAFSSVSDYVLFDVNAKLFGNFIGQVPQTSALLNMGNTNAYLSKKNMQQLHTDGLRFIMKHKIRYAFFHTLMIPRLFIQDQYLDMFKGKTSGTSLPGLDLYAKFIRFDARGVIMDFLHFLRSPIFLIYVVGKIIWISLFMLMLGSLWVFWKEKKTELRRAGFFLMIFVLWYATLIGPVTRAGHRLPINLLVILLASVTYISLRRRNVFI